MPLSCNALPPECPLQGRMDASIAGALRTQAMFRGACLQVVGTGGGRSRKGKKGAEKQYESHEDPGWESEVRTREDEVAEHEERIMIKEFRERLAFNLGKVCPACC